ncbi:MAG: Glu/Leu/Phe/Val dehydrogenase dimerization domain-containing protein [bacterium]
MPEDIFFLQGTNAERCFFLNDPISGLRAILVLDDLTLGPAAGGIRTRQYSSTAAAIEDASNLARAMTVKCALAGIDAGGGKAVVMLHEEMNRPKAFEKLGAYIEELGGIFHTAGDLGTTAEDLVRVARKTTHVETSERGLTDAVAVGMVCALQACASRKSKSSLVGLTILVQGCGAIGTAVARKLVRKNAKILLTDIDATRAQKLASEIGGNAIEADNWLAHEFDIFCPCAIGGVLDVELASGLKAWAVCGAANNVIAEPEAEQTLIDRGILFVPDVIASAGAVIEGVGKSIMGLDNCSHLINRIGATTETILDVAYRENKLPTVVANEWAYRRIAAAKELMISK